MSSPEKCRSKRYADGAKKTALLLSAAAAVSSVIFYGSFSLDGGKKPEVLKNNPGCSSKNLPGGVFLGPPKLKKGCSPPSSAPPASGWSNDIRPETYNKNGYSSRNDVIEGPPKKISSISDVKAKQEPDLELQYSRNDLAKNDNQKTFVEDEINYRIDPIFLIKNSIFFKQIFTPISNYLYQTLIEEKSIWFWTLLCSLAVMSTGIVPAFFMPDGKCASTTDTENSTGNGISELQLNRLLSFAVGSLLGDVFFHLLPESWAESHGQMDIGFYVIAGILTCLVLEKFCAKSEESQHYVAALANLAANIMDNFTHGLAVGGSFLISRRLGFLTTFAILLHEIPHEISDFAILLRADFDRWSAIKAQVCFSHVLVFCAKFVTATGGVLGALVALISSTTSEASSGHSTSSWILPFTAGGFLNIALVQILPDLMKERQFKENVHQVSLIVLGIAVMAMLNSSLVNL